MSEHEAKINTEQPDSPPTTPPDGWADVYRDLMETVWVMTEPGPADAQLTVEESRAEAAALRGLVAYATEIRHGIAAGLLAPVPVPDPDACEQCAHASEMHEQLGCVVADCRCARVWLPNPQILAPPPVVGYGTGPHVDPATGRHGPQA